MAFNTELIRGYLSLKDLENDDGDELMTNPTTSNTLLNKLKAIKQEAYADIFDTYDYNIIAEGVLELLGEYEEQK